MYKASFVLLAAFLISCPLAQANMRAPRHVSYAPSFSLHFPPTSNLIVEKKKLNIDCNYERCDVQAVYFIKSDKQEELEFVFVLPENTSVQASVTGTPRPTSVKQDKAHTWTSSEYGHQELPLYQATFSGNIYKGLNIINIKYSQPLTIREMSYGYFTASRSIEQFTYQLGPLKEWTLNDGFSLEVSLSSLRKRPERDGGWSLIKSRNISCLNSNQVVSTDRDNINLMLKFGKVFPDTLVCQMGDGDLLGNTE